MAKIVVKCLIPNLDRRTDRWQVCHEKLIDRGVPSENIEKFPSYDGRQYPDLSAVKTEASQTFGGTLPPFLKVGDWDRFDFCWRWTWYAMLHKIQQSNNVKSVAYLTLIDDWEILMDYGELCSYLEMLEKISGELHMLQLGLSPNPIPGKCVSDISLFQHGLAGRCDCAMIYTPVGARYLLRYANGLPKLPVSPSELLEWFSKLSTDNQVGCFAISANRRTAAQGYKDARVSVYEDRLESKNEVFCIIPNLNRRSEKWYACRKRLLARGVPDANIIRFAAHDHQDYNNFDDVTRDVARQFDGIIPSYLEKEHRDKLKSHYCWLWTWYSIIHKISHEEYGFYLLLIDDCELLIDYDDLCKNLQLLRNISQHPIRIIQLKTQQGLVKHIGDIVEAAPLFQYGLACQSDSGTIFTSEGAQFMLDWANTNSDVRDPYKLMSGLSDELNQHGVFAISEQYEPRTGAVSYLEDIAVDIACSNREESKNEVFVIIPNLDRRSVRWRVCYERLRARGVPANHIERFSSFDHRRYGDYTEAKSAATQYFRGQLPKFLNRHLWRKSDYCWLWTWYAIVHKISHKDNGLHLLIVDDCEILLDYESLCRELQVMVNVSKPNDVRIVQLAQDDAPVWRKVVEENSVFQYGLSGRGDSGIIFSPGGARFMLEWANKNSDVDVPAVLFQRLAKEPDQQGFFANSEQYKHKRGVVKHYKDNRVHEYSDRLETKHAEHVVGV